MDQAAKSNITASPISGQDLSQIQSNPGGWFKKNIVKVIVILLVIAVIGELIFGGITLFSPSTSRNLSIIPPKINNLSDASLSLIADKTSYKKGEPVMIDVKLFTGGYITDSTDLVIKYDPKYLEPKSEAFAQEGQIYSEYPALQVDKEKGLIGISGITLPGNNGFSGVGSFAKLSFLALQEGQTQISIDFEVDQTADSNVVLSGSSRDILRTVANADIIISESGNQSNTIRSGQKCEGFTQYCLDSAGNNGSQMCSGGSLKDGSCGYDPVYTVSCQICKI